MSNPNPRYRDVMDPSREVSPTGRGNECRVYFDGQFVGKTQVPSSLIGNERIGFLPDWTPPPPVVREDRDER